MTIKQLLVSIAGESIPLTTAIFENLAQRHPTPLLTSMARRSKALETKIYNIVLDDRDNNRTDRGSVASEYKTKEKTS